MQVNAINKSFEEGTRWRTASGDARQAPAGIWLGSTLPHPAEGNSVEDENSGAAASRASAVNESDAESLWATLAGPLEAAFAAAQRENARYDRVVSGTTGAFGRLQRGEHALNSQVQTSPGSAAIPAVNPTSSPIPARKSGTSAAVKRSFSQRETVPSVPVVSPEVTPIETKLTSATQPDNSVSSLMTTLSSPRPKRLPAPDCDLDEENSDGNLNSSKVHASHAAGRSQRLRAMNSYENPEDVSFRCWLKGWFKATSALIGLRFVKIAFGERSTHMLPFLDALSDIYHDRRHVDHAEELYAKALRIRIQHYGRDDHRCATGLRGLARISHECARYGEAEQLLQEVVTLSEKRLCKISFLTERSADRRVHEASDAVLLSIYELAQLFLEQGKLQRAEEQFRRALAVWHQVPQPAPDAVCETATSILCSYKELLLISNRASEADPLDTEFSAHCKS